MANRIDRAFRKARRENRAAFMPFVTAGDPDIETTAAIIIEISRRGADLIELGVPYSDPIADGPTIQASYTRALSGGLRLSQIFDMLHGVRAACDTAILTMVSFSIVLRVGPEAYFEHAAAAGADGVIIPDLPADEAGRVARQANARGLHNVCLVAPTTPPDRMARIARLSRGFIYYVSTTGTTGARDRLSADLSANVADLRKVTPKPIAVGFGISKPEHVRDVSRYADGAIVGSAIVRRIHELANGPRAELIGAIGDVTEAMAQAARRP